MNFKPGKKARLDELTSKTNEALASVPAAVAKADKPADLDPVLDALLRATPSNGNIYGFDPDMQAQNARLTTTYRFVAQWQDYLSYRDTKNAQQELNILHSLLNSQTGGEPIIPRSEILARVAPLEEQVQAGNVPRSYAQPPPPDLAPIFDSIKTVDDLEPAVRQVALLPNAETLNAAELGQLASLYGQTKNGLPVSLDLNSYVNGIVDPAISRIKSMVLLYVLPRYLGPGAPSPNPNEQVTDYLTRTMTVAETAQNWALVQCTLIAEMKIAHVQPGLAPQMFLSGLSQEIVQQYSNAVADYQSALRSPDAYTPSAFIGKRLASIKKDHPAEYAGGMQTFDHPPAPLYPLGYYNAYGMRNGMPGYPPSAPGNPTTPTVKSPSQVSTPALTPASPVTTPPANK